MMSSSTSYGLIFALAVQDVDRHWPRALQTEALVLHCRGPASPSRRAGIYRAFEDWSGREDDGLASRPGSR